MALIRSMKLMSLPPIIFLLLSAFAPTPSVVQQARAATTGLVCIADQSLNPTDCPSSPANLTGAAGNTISVAVNVQGVDSFNGFDIWVRVNPAVLQPVIISLADSLIQEPRFIVRQSVDPTSGVAHVAMVALAYHVIGTGNMFEIVYNVVSSNIGTPIEFMLGCSAYSGGLAPSICAVLANESKLVPAAVQAANFGSVAPDFSLTAFSAFPTTSENANAGLFAEVGVVLGSIDEFNGTVNLSVALATPCPSETCPSLSLSSTTLSPPPGGASWTTVGFSAPPEHFGSPITNWSVKVTGTSGSISHTAMITFKVLPPDFSIWWQGAGFVQPGSTTNVTIFLRSDGGFGKVNLTVSQDCSASTCLLWTLNATSLALSPGAIAQTTLAYSAPSMKPNSSVIAFHLKITGTSDNVSHYTLVGFTVRDFNFTTNLSALIVARGKSAPVMVNASNWNYNWVSPSMSISPDIKKDPTLTWGTYYPCVFGELPVERTACFGYVPWFWVLTNSTTHPGTFTVTLTASNGWFTHTATLTLTVVANDPPKGH